MIPSSLTRSWAVSLAVALSLALALTGCSRDRDATIPDAAPDREQPAPARSAPARRLVFLGTSLTAGYGLPDPGLAYPALIQRRIDRARLGYRVVNAGVSGATSADTRRGIDWIMTDPVAVLVIETGANDGLRGLDVDSMRANIQAIIDRARRQSPPPRIVIVGMEAPPNYGAGYTRRFREVFPELARANGATYIPFLLGGVAGIDSLNQGDGIHPTAAGQRIIAASVWQVLEPLLR
jgi:acyl-CoA thioesterase I